MPESAVSLRIGVISDTHGLLRPQAVAALHDVDHIIHAGDIGSPDILTALAEVAPLTVVRGNNDTEPWAESLPERLTKRIGGVQVHLLHNLKELDIDPAAAGVQVVIAGHSHRPLNEWREGVLYLNPGSAGPRRFQLPVSVAEIIVEHNAFEARIIELAV